ncbi:elongation factor P maturation arginine rhamnosyltransferase EarP [Piscinibacter sakaiensis]|uniref:elongation factor P maturation arginine rhamnosyltransferase EarP n=1 Tax=Piscinibacter sakaiensis TaxID=1547922 RepID=UPI00372922AB
MRGEDSAVRAQWAGRPFVWQLYPQDDGADHAKREAFLQRFLAATAPVDARRSRAWRAHLLAQDDLVTRLLGFVASLPGHCG